MVCQLLQIIFWILHFHPHPVGNVTFIISQTSWILESVSELFILSLWFSIFCWIANLFYLLKFQNILHYLVELIIYYFFLFSRFPWASTYAIFYLSFHIIFNFLLIYYRCYILSAAATAAKLFQSCLTLCDPIDGSPPGSPVPGILQARTLKWVAISFSNAWKWKVKVKSLSCAQLLATPWTGAYQAPPSMGFSRQGYWSGVPLWALTIFWAAF